MYFLFLKTLLKVRQTMTKNTPAAANVYMTTTRAMWTVAMSFAGTPS